MDHFYRQYLDAPVDRRNTDCEKWDFCERVFGRADVLPLWVADMDFPTAPCVVEAMEARLKHPVFGYTDSSAKERAAEIGWIRRRYGMEIEPEWILFSPGVVDSVFFCVRALTEPGDGVLIQPPVYGPFKRAVDTFERRLIENPLGSDGERMGDGLRGPRARLSVRREDDDPLQPAQPRGPRLDARRALPRGGARR